MNPDQMLELEALERYYAEQTMLTKETNKELILLFLLGLPEWRRRDIDSIAPKIIKAQNATNFQVAQLALSRLKKSRLIFGVSIDKIKPISSKDFTISEVNGYDSDKVFVDRISSELYARLAEGDDFEKARKKALNRMNYTSDLTAQKSANKVWDTENLEADRVKRYVRMLGIRKTHCERCVRDTLNVYKSPKMIYPLHNQCGCYVREIYIANPNKSFLMDTQNFLNSADRKILA